MRRRDNETAGEGVLAGLPRCGLRAHRHASQSTDEAGLGDESGDVEAIEIHDLVPRGAKSRTNFSFASSHA